MKVNTLKISDKNPRKITGAALDKLAESIKRDPQFMVLRPIVIDDDKVVLGGNQRLKAIQKLGMKEIPDAWVVKASGLSQEQKQRFILVDNAPSGMAGEWDIDLLSAQWEVPTLQELGFDIEALGLGGKEEGVEQEEEENREEIKELFMVVINCSTEEEQIMLLERFQGEGLQCKALVS